MSFGAYSAQPPPPSGTKKCPYCGFKLPATSTVCPLCHESQVIREGAPPLKPMRESDFPVQQARGDNPAWVLFGILTILVCVGLALEVPGLLIFLLILAIPALIRMAIVLYRQQAETGSGSGISVIGSFLSSLGIIVVVGLAAYLAFLISCGIICLGVVGLEQLNPDVTRGSNLGPILIFGTIIALIPTAALAVWLLYLTRPRKA